MKNMIMILTKRRNCYLLAFFTFYTIGIFGQQNADATVPTIHVNEKLEIVDLKLSDICSDIAYTKLEFNPKYPVHDASQLWSVHVTNEYIIFENQEEFFRYSRDGKKVEKISSLGQGSREYLGGSSFVVDEKSNQMYIQKNFTKDIMVYDYVNNKYLNTFKLPFEYDCSISMADYGTILIVGSTNRRYASTIRYFSLKLLNSEGKILFEKTNPDFIIPKSENPWKGIIEIGGATTHWKDNAYSFCSIHERGSDTIFGISQELKVTPRFTIDCPVRNQGENATYFYAESSNYLFWILSNNNIKTQYRGFYDKTLKKSYLYTQYSWKESRNSFITGVKNDFDGGLPVIIPFDSNSSSQWNYFVNSLELMEYVKSPTFKNAIVKDPEKKAKLEHFVKTLDEDDNPVLVTLTLK